MQLKRLVLHLLTKAVTNTVFIHSETKSDHSTRKAFPVKCTELILKRKSNKTYLKL